MVPMAPSSTRLRSRATRRSFSSAGEIGADMEMDSGLLPLPAGARGGVRGFRRLALKCAQDRCEPTFKIAHHLVVPEPEHEITARFQVSPSIFIFLRATCVLAPVKLDDEPRVRATAVRDKAVERPMATKFPSAKSAIAQAEPPDWLRIGLLPAQSPRDCGHVRHGEHTNHADPNPLTPPLSPAGRASRPSALLC